MITYSAGANLTPVLNAITAHKVATDATGLIVVNIHDVDLPAIPTDNYSSIKHINGTTGSASYITLVDFSGSGKFYSMTMYDSAADFQVKITIDGDVHEVDSLVFKNDPGVSVHHGHADSTISFNFIDYIPYANLNCDFKTGLKIEVKCGGGILHYGLNYAEV